MAAPVNGHNTHILQLGAGGRQDRSVDHVGSGRDENVARLGLGTAQRFYDVLLRGMRMAVNEHINAGHLLQQVNGAIAGRLGVNAQMSQADDVLAVGILQHLHLRLGQVEHLLSGQEGHALDFAGIGLGGGFGGVQAEYADLGAIRRGEDHVILKSRPAVVGDVGIHNGKVGVLFQGLDVVVSVVKLVVAQAHHIVAR